MKRLFQFILFLLVAVPVLQAQDSLLIQQSQQQVQQYVRAIQNGHNPGINLWALAQVSRNRVDLQQYTKQYVEENPAFGPVLQAFTDTTLSRTELLKRGAFSIESPFLLVAYLLEEPDSEKQKTASSQYRNEIGYPSGNAVNYPQVVNALLQQQPITEAMLPPDQFYPLHYLLFFKNDLVYNGKISSEYLETAAEKWSTSNGLKYSSLTNILSQATLFRTYYLLDQYEQIEPLYDKIIRDTDFPISANRLMLMRMLDYSMYRVGYYNRSLEIIRSHGVPLAEFLGQEQVALKMEIAKGSYLYYIGRIEQSKQVYTQIQESNKTTNLNISKARILNNSAVNYWKSGEFDRYLELQFKALEEAKKESNYRLRFDIFHNLFTHYRINKDYNSAKQYLTKAKEIAEEQEDKDNLAWLSFLEGQLYHDSESDYQKAIASFDKALNLLEYENSYESYQNILSEKALLFEKQKKYNQAKSIFTQVLQNATVRDDNTNAYYAAFSKANLHMGLGQQDSAQIMLDTLRTKNLESLDFYQLVKARIVQARYQAQHGEPREGTDILQPVIEQIVQRSRGSGTLETGFWQIEPEYLDAFELYANLLIDTDRQEGAVEALDRLKTINDAAMYQNPLVRSKVLNERELSEYKRLTNQLDALRRQLLAASGGQRDDIQQKIDKRSARKNALDRKITANANPKPVSVNQIQRGMDAYERLLHLTELNDTYYLAVISRTSVEFKKIPITQKMRERFKMSIAEMSKGSTDMIKLWSITEMLELHELPDHVSTLTIIPDSYLYQLPMDILPVEKPENSYSYGHAKYLIERFATSYMTSLSDFNNPKNSRKTKYDYTGYGVAKFGEDRTRLVPLPEAKTEIERIASQLTKLKEKKIFLNESATEETFREAAPNARILHMATHSEVSNQDPMFSSIYLSRSENDDPERFPGRIFAYELFELNLSNELVMLNSCESGSGSYLQGTGIVGISRALRYAGASALVLNLWSVNDMLASDFAAKFYNGINKGHSKSEALRNAKLHFLKTKNANPHYWGSYMLLGNQKPIVQPNRLTRNIVAGSFLLFFFSLAIASSFVEIRRRQNAG